MHNGEAGLRDQMVSLLPVYRYLKQQLINSSERLSETRLSM
ncbi:hypothetical protein [Aliamphritea spongicola]|nr:hypothetical protein [Aliamphritea spongicola]